MKEECNMPNIKWSLQLWIEPVYKKSILISSDVGYFPVIDYVEKIPNK